MDSIAKILKYQLRDMIRSKWVIGYALFFLLATYLLFQFGGRDVRVLASLMNVVFIVVPLVSLIFGALYVYQSREFIELLLCQPIRRPRIFLGLYLGLAGALCLCFIVGVGLPFAVYGLQEEGDRGRFGTLILSGILLTLVFSALAWYIATVQEDRARGFGWSLLLWVFFAVLYDGVVLLAVYGFGDYPLEYPVIVLSLLNPVDLARILLMLQLDVSALLGYTGAVFQKFFGSASGMAAAVIALVFWSVAPVVLGLRRFLRKDF
jgi:Cu-processing system permease protein